MRLSPGEFARPESDRETWSARALFLERVARLVPSVLTELRRDVLPAYQRAFGKSADEAVDENTRFQLQWTNDNTPETAQSHAEAGELEQALLAWADKYHLRATWLLNTALSTLQLWNRGLFHWQWGRPSRGPGVPAGLIPRVKFEFRPWQVDWETEQQFLRRVSVAFRHELKKYLHEIEVLAAQHQWRRIGEKRSHRRRDKGCTPPVREHGYRHFDWLVLWQVMGKTHAELASAARVNTKTVAAATRDIAKLIGLPRRSEPLTARKRDLRQ